MRMHREKGKITRCLSNLDELEVQICLLSAIRIEKVYFINKNGRVINYRNNCI